MANNPNSAEKIAARKAARKASGMSAQKFYVTTRLAEAAKSGKKLDRAALRKKFQSGDVARKGFAAPKKKTGGSGSSSTGSSSSSKTSSSYTPGMGGNPKTNATGSTSKSVGAGDAALDPLKYLGRRATQNMRVVPGYKSGNVQKSTKPLYSSFGGTSKDKSKYNYKGPGAKDPANKTSTLKAKADAKTAKNKVYLYKGPGAKDPANKTSTLKAKADQKAKEKNQPQRGPGRSRGR